MDHNDQQFTLKCHSLIANQAVQLTRLVGREAISSLFDFQLTIITNQPIKNPTASYGQPIHFSLCDGQHKPRDFYAIINKITRTSSNIRQQFQYQLCAVPWLWLLDQSIDNNMFTNLSVIDITQQILQQHGFHDIDISNIQKKHPKLDYCAQYQESYYHFIDRILTEAGIYYFFTHDQQKCILNLADLAQAYQAIETPIAINSLNPANQFNMTQWQSHLILTSTEFSARDYSFKTPEQTLQAHKHANQQAPALPHNIYPGQFMNSAEAQDKIKQAIEISNNCAASYTGTSNAYILSAATRFALVNTHTNQQHPFVVTQIHHEAIDASNNQQESSQIQSYRNQIHCILADTCFMKSIKHLQPRMHGIQLANVINTDSQIIHTDNFARIKVTPHWQYTQHPQHISYWLRVQQPSAGQRWGHHFTPRVSSEVAICYRNGNANQPHLLGSIYNTLHPVALQLPKSSSQSGIITQTLDKHAVGHNLLVFEDKQQAEKYVIHAQHNLTKTILHDLSEHIAHNHNRYIAKGNQQISIAKGASQLQAKSLTLQVGSSRIQMNSSGIHIDSNHASLLAAHNGSTRGIARLHDQQKCPKHTDAGQAHKGGPIKQGSANVLIEGKPVARVSDPVKCQHAKAKIQKGAPGILVNNKLAARLHDKTTHGGKITSASNAVSSSEYSTFSGLAAPTPADNDLLIEFATIDQPSQNDSQQNGENCTVRTANQKAQHSHIQDDQAFIHGMTQQQLQQTNEVSIDSRE